MKNILTTLSIALLVMIAGTPEAFANKLLQKLQLAS